MAVYTINKQALLQEDFDFIKSQIEKRNNSNSSFGGGLNLNGGGLSGGLSRIADNYAKKQKTPEIDPFKPLSYSKTGQEPAYATDHAVPVGH